MSATTKSTTQKTAKLVAISENRDHEEEERKLTPRALLRAFGMLGNYKYLVFLGNILCFLCVTAEMHIIDQVHKLMERDDLLTAPIWSLTAWLLFYCLACRFGGTAQWLITSYATNKALAKLRMRFFETLLEKSHSFYDRHKAGWLVARNTGDMQTLWEFMTFVLLLLMVFAAVMITALGKMASIDPMLLLPCIVIVPMVLVMTHYYKKHMIHTQREAREQNSRLVANIAETVRGIRVVHAFAREEKNLEDFSDINRTSHDLEIRVGQLNGLFMPSLDLIGTFSIIIVITFGMYLMQHAYVTHDGTPLSPGDLAAYVLYMNAIIFPLRMVMEVYSLMLGASVASERVFEVIDYPTAVKQPAEPRATIVEHGEIVFDNVSFRYGGEDEWVLRNLDLTIPAGENLAVVGHTGAGKTTLASLVSRFYDVTEGELRIDGTNIRDYDLDGLHQSMGIVLQHGYLFSGTVLDNLRFARPDATDEEIQQTARDLGTHDAIESLPDGYQTQVLEGGESLSLGQRQLISITRAIVAHPRILILDEPTSSLDVYTERILQQALDRLRKGRTMLVIAHRLSTVRNADRILVMDQGKIVEQGSHEQLVQRNGYYAELVRRSEQLGPDETGALHA